MLKKLLLFGLCLLAAPGLPQLAAAQALDPTFTAPTGLYTLGAVYSLGAQQADGKRVVAGYFTRVNNTAVGGLVRLDAAGALDADFAKNVGLARNVGRVKALPGGQYLVSSFFNEAVTAGGLTRPALLRLNANGTADAAFNAGTGVVNTALDYAAISTLAGQADGKVLVGGKFTAFSGQNTNGLVRLTATGAVDAAFVANLGTGFNGPVNTITVQPDGKILVGGSYTAFNGQPTAALLRLNADGTRDATFTSSLYIGSYVGALLVQPDGRVLATGVLGFAGTDASIVRLTATGAADTGFTAPAYTRNYAFNYFDTNVQLQPDGKIIFSGAFNAGATNYLIRLNANGSVDPSFGAGGNGASQQPYVIGLQSDGSLWIGGQFSALHNRETALGRLTSTGTVDDTFVPKIQAPGIVRALARQPDGQLLMGGDFTELNGVAVHRVARLSAAGTLDAAFAAASPVIDGLVTALGLQPDGKLVVGTSYKLLRLLATGTADASYGASLTLGGIEKLAVQPDGKVLALGYFYTPGGSATQNLVRLTASGDYDPAFTVGTTNAPGATLYLTALALQPDGKVLVGGSFSAAGGPALRVVRYESTGAVDATFSSSTTFEVPIPASGSGPIVRFNTLALQADGKVLVGGYFATVNGAARPNLARLSATGQLDASFAPAALTGAVTALALQPNGRVLVGSGSGNDGAATTTPLVRLLAAGASDPSFGATGTPNDAVAALLVQPNEAIVVGGSFTAIGGQPANGMARLTAPNTLAAAAPAALSAFSVWPVPAHELLHVAAAPGAQAAELRDALGRVVRQQALRGTPEFTLATDNLPAGVYVLRVQYASGPVARRVVVE